MNAAFEDALYLWEALEAAGDDRVKVRELVNVNVVSLIYSRRWLGLIGLIFCSAHP